MPPTAAAKSNSSIRVTVGVSRYEQTAGALIALLILLGICVFIMLSIWLAGRLAPGLERTVEIALHEGSGGDPDSTTTEGMLIEAPDLAEIAQEVREPLETFQDTLLAVDQLVKTPDTQLLNLLEPQQVRTGGRSQGTGSEPAYGEGGGAGGVQRGQRWEIRYPSGIAKDVYAVQLDFFGIELAAVARDGRIEYVRNVSSPRPTIERDRSGPERRLFMTWREGSPRREADKQVLEGAGINTLGKTLAQFLPDELERTMARLELEFAGRKPGTIQKTVFAVRPKGAGFEMYVDEQIAR